MSAFVIAAGIMTVIHVVAGWQRPRRAVIVSGILWLLYAVWELQVATGVLCDTDCNIRVDLVFIPSHIGARNPLCLPGVQPYVTPTVAA